MPFGIIVSLPAHLQIGAFGRETILKCGRVRDNAEKAALKLTIKNQSLWVTKLIKYHLK